MPIPTSITDLSTTAGSNSPQGSDSPTQGDDYLRALSSIIRQEYEYSGANVISVQRYGADATGSTEALTAIQAAITACPEGGTVVFQKGGLYKLNSSSVVVQQKSITLDFNGCDFTAATPNSVAAFAFIPASLVTAGRLTGADYPASWKNGATPLPMDSDFDTMMHESTAGNRSTRIVLKNANVSSALNRTFVSVYSADSVVFHNCSIKPTGYSAARILHSQRITADSTNTFGGTGTYLMFLFKCMTYDISARFESASAIRACSAKGVMHPVGTSIFADFGSTVQPFNSKFSGHVIDGKDGIFWDTTPNFTEDAVGARGGSAIGFTSGSWYGKGRGLEVVGANIALPSCSPGSGGAEGRGVWASAPHQGVSIKSCQFKDAIIFLTGVLDHTVSNNDMSYSKGIGYAVEIQGDSTSSTDTIGSDVSENRVHDWVVIGTITRPFRVGATACRFNQNKVYYPGTGTTDMVAWAGNFTGNSDYIFAEGNTVFHALGTSPNFGSFGSNNANGYASNNLIIDTTGTNPIATTAYRMRDDGAGSGLRIFASDDATGYAGMAFYNKAGTTQKAQFYWDAATNTLRLGNGGDRVRVSSAGLTPNTDNAIPLGTASLRWTQLFSGNVVLSSAAASGGAGTVVIGGTVQTTVGTAGGASAQPATPAGYLLINVAGNSRAIPYHNP